MKHILPLKSTLLIIESCYM